MARPSNRLIKEYDLILQFQKAGISTIFNLQQNGEHQLCGDGVDQSSGFAYNPQFFIDNGSTLVTYFEPLIS